MKSSVVSSQYQMPASYLGLQPEKRVVFVEFIWYNKYILYTVLETTFAISRENHSRDVLLSILSFIHLQYCFKEQILA